MGVGRKQLERATPRGEPVAEISRLRVAIGVRRQTLQLLGIHEAVAGGGGE